MNEITYIFGAGASCQAMPLVNNFRERFAVFIKFMRANDFQSTEILPDANEFLIQIKAHASFDTFFKKLFHQQKHQSIHKYKKVLLSYLIFEHLIDIPSYNELAQEEDVSKAFNIDPRYEALIAGLLKPTPKTEFYTSVNFITWNYDLNLFLALKNFIYPQRPLDEIYDEIYNDGIFGFKKQANLIHLNGQAFHPIINAVFSEGEVKNDAFKLLFETYSSPYFGDEAFQIKFAWETDDPQKIEQAKLMINRSNTIIICGYSLPLYNRVTDLAFLNPETINGKRLIIQDVASNSVWEILKSDFELDFLAEIKHIELETRDNCNSFYVPRSIFNTQAQP